MGFRFRKSIKLGGARINLSKSGIGGSIGVRGARVGVGPRGRRTTLSIPGTGLSYQPQSKSRRGRTGAGSGSCLGYIVLAAIALFVAVMVWQFITTHIPLVIGALVVTGGIYYLYKRRL